MTEKAKKIDSRILRSRRDLENALESLLTEKNLDDITITEITNRAMVSKNTFYNNFHDKNELLNALFERYADDLRQTLLKIMEEHPGDEEATFLELSKVIVHFFYTSSLSFQKAIQNDKSRSLYWAMDSFIQNLTKTALDKYSSYRTNDIPPSMVSYFYSGALCNLIYNMNNYNEAISEKDCVRYLDQLVIHPLFHA